MKFLRTEVFESLFLKFDLLQKNGFHEKANKLVKFGLNFDKDLNFEFLYFHNKIKENDPLLDQRIFCFLKERPDFNGSLLNVFEDHYKKTKNAKMLTVLFYYELQNGLLFNFF